MSISFCFIAQSYNILRKTKILETSTCCPQVKYKKYKKLLFYNINNTTATSDNFVGCNKYAIICVPSLYRVAPCNFMLSIVHRQPLVSPLRRKYFEDLHVIISVVNVLWFYGVMLLRVLSQHLPDRV
jgi:hypothetical protein